MLLRPYQLLFLAVTNVIFVAGTSRNVSFTVAFKDMGDCEPWFYPGQKCDPYCKIYSKPVDSEQVLIAETASLSETNSGEFKGEYTCSSSNEQDMLLFEFYDDNWPWSSDYYGDCSFTVKEIVEGKPAIKNIESSMASGSTAIVTCTSATKPKSSDLE